MSRKTILRNERKRKILAFLRKPELKRKNKSIHRLLSKKKKKHPSTIGTSPNLIRPSRKVQLYKGTKRTAAELYSKEFVKQT